MGLWYARCGLQVEELGTEWKVDLVSECRFVVSLILVADEMIMHEMQYM